MISQYLYKMKYNFLKQSHAEIEKKHAKTMEHKSYLTLVINLCVFVGATGGQSVHQYIYVVLLQLPNLSPESEA